MDFNEYVASKLAEMRLREARDAAERARLLSSLPQGRSLRAALGAWLVHAGHRLAGTPGATRHSAPASGPSGV